MNKQEKKAEISKEKRAKVLREFGIIPTSILKYDPTDRAIRLLADKEPTFNDPKDKERWLVLQDKYPKYIAARLFHQQGIKKSGHKTLGLSVYPQNVGRILVKLYTEPGDTVFDPCAGHNSRMQLVYESGRNYVGYDISQEFVEMNRKIRRTLLKQKKHIFPTGSIELKKQDSRSVPLENDSVDFVLTSPPYWNTEFYGSEPGQVGECSTYERFLEKLLPVVGECYRVLKPDKFCVFHAANLRKNRKFYPFHADVIGLFRRAGFVLWDVTIIDWGDHPLRAIFASEIKPHKLLPKRHEYAIVGRKKNG